MPRTEIIWPVSSAPIDRLALGVGWVRPGAGNIGNTLNPASAVSGHVTGTYALCGNGNRCFEGNDE